VVTSNHDNGLMEAETLFSIARSKPGLNLTE
jgi:hypothetical protein